VQESTKTDKKHNICKDHAYSECAEKHSNSTLIAYMDASITRILQNHNSAQSKAK
jgi:hypothetical protein